MVAGVLRGSGVKPLAPTISELHVRHIFFIVALELLDVLACLIVNKLGGAKIHRHSTARQT